MSVSTYVPATSGNTAKIDGNFAVLTRLGDAFAPHGQSSPDMTVRLDAGHVFDGVTLTEVAAQSTGTITAPASDSRIDRIVINRLTGVLSVVTGTASASPVAPAIPADSAPVAQVLLASTSTVIENGMITDERDLTALGSPASGGNLLNVQTFTASGTYTPTTGTTKAIVEVLGGGGSGGGCGATSSSQAAAASGGASGSYARAVLTVSGAVTVTVGAGGAAPAAGANDGNAGGTTSFGASVSASGGGGGKKGTAFAPPVVTGGGGPTGGATGGNLVSAYGQLGGHGFTLSLGSVVGGTGGSSCFGGGGIPGGNGAGVAGAAPGADGGGASSIFSSSARVGGAGANGLVVIYEYA